MVDDRLIKNFLVFSANFFFLHVAAASTTATKQQQMLRRGGVSPQKNAFFHNLESLFGLRHKFSLLYLEGNFNGSNFFLLANVTVT